MISFTPNQLEAIGEIDHNLQIVACAGSGKTEVITRRIANILTTRPEVKPENIVAFTFTEKAAASLRQRVEKVLGEQRNANIPTDGMYVGTIHAFCWHLLCTHSDRFSGFRILDTVKAHLFVERYSEKCGMRKLDLVPGVFNNPLFLECMEKMADSYEVQSEWTEQQRNAFESYRNCLKEYRFLDFNMLLFETLKELETNKALRDYISTIQYLVVDEYQDISDLQERLIEMIYRGGANICVVGDDDQTIYQFRGSNADNMVSFSKRYPNVRQIRLECNFRCAPEIVEMADTVIRNNENRLEKMMHPSENQASGVVEAIECDDLDAQAEKIAHIADSLHREGIPYNEMCVLVRKGKFSLPVGKAFSAQGIPFASYSTEDVLHSEPFRRLQNTMLLLSSLDKPNLYQIWEDIVPPEKLNTGFKLLRRICRDGGRGPSLTMSSILEAFCDEIGYTEIRSGDEAMALDAIMTILEDYDTVYGDIQLSQRITKLKRFLEYAPEEYKYHIFGTQPEKKDEVQILTVHKAKGLEYTVVFIPELVEKHFPASGTGGKKYYSVLGGYFEEHKQKYMSDIDDERKLFYVAITRAKRRLYMLYETGTHRVSRFIKEAAETPSISLQVEDQDFTDSEYQIARKRLVDYYGTATHFNSGAYGDLERVLNCDRESVLAEARKLHLL